MQHIWRQYHNHCNSHQHKYLHSINAWTKSNNFILNSDRTTYTIFNTDTGEYITQDSACRSITLHWTCMHFLILEYASIILYFMRSSIILYYVCSLSSHTFIYCIQNNITKLPIIQNTALCIATGCILETKTNIQQQHDKTKILHTHLKLHVLQIRQTRNKLHSIITNTPHTSKNMSWSF